jgi:hypothetical protein
MWSLPRPRVIEAKLDQLTPQAPPAPVPALVPAPRTNLLVGRADDLAWLCARLQAGGQAALVGVRGLGGIGKTELAIAAAQTVTPAFAGGGDLAGVRRYRCGRRAAAPGRCVGSGAAHQRPAPARRCAAQRAGRRAPPRWSCSTTCATPTPLLSTCCARPRRPARSWSPVAAATCRCARVTSCPWRPSRRRRQRSCSPFCSMNRESPLRQTRWRPLQRCSTCLWLWGWPPRRAAQLAQAQARRRGAVAAPGLPPVAALLAELGERRLGRHRPGWRRPTAPRPQRAPDLWHELRRVERGGPSRVPLPGGAGAQRI